MSKIIPLSEGAFTVDQTKKFIPFDKQTDNLQDRKKGSLLVEIQPFVVITSNDIILLDSGLGFAGPDGQLQIHKNLAANGINSDDVTKVLMSHLHKDHTGGIARPNKKIISFENATYYINKNEWEYAFEKGLPSYHVNNFALLSKKENLILTEGDGMIDDYISYTVTGAHTPYHQVFKISDEGSIIFYGGDVAPQLQQMKNRFKAKYDFDGNASMDLRQKWWQQGQEEKWTFLFYHDLRQPTFSFE
jgi:glyoxylase-like metal-dependent hydrolase (beta-lactamase superfamily II)